MARRARQSRSRGSEVGSIPASPYVRRSLAFFDPLNEEDLTRLEAQVDWIFEDVGIAFRDDPEALELWRREGARVEGDIVRADAQWIRNLCAKAPKSFTQVARNPERSVVIGDCNQVFAPVYGAPFVRDLEGGRRYGDIDSFEKLVKLTYMHPNLHHGGFVTCEPCDVPVSKRHLDMMLAHMTLSDKPHLGAITEMSRAQDSVEMAEIVFGADFMEENCVIMGNVNTNSPLLVDRVVTESARVYSARGQGLIVVPFILSGAMGPVSTAASVAQAMAEAMMVCAYVQLLRPGAPFVLGNFLSSMSLKSGAPTFGMPEPVMSNYAIGQLARRAGLPLRCGGSLTASKIEDAQAAYESADSMHSTMLAGANFVLHSAGWLEGGLCTGFEKLIMDADRLGSYQKVLSQGLDISDDAFARDAYDEVEPGGHFLGCAHTMRNYQTAFYEPKLSDSENVESWEEGGSKDMRRRAYERWNQMLNEYQPPAMDEAKKEELSAYVARRKEEIQMRGIKITGLRATPVNIPLEKPMWWTGGHYPGTSKTIIEVETDQGLIGLGEAPSVDVVEPIRAMGVRLVGADALDIAGCESLCVPPWQIVQNTDDSSVVKAFGAIEIALWDLRGKVANEPLYRLLGGAVRKDIPFTEYFGYREGGEMSPEAVADYCIRMREEHGSTMFEGKLILGDPELEIDTVKALREGLGREAMIRLDSNMQWSLPTAMRVFREIEPYNIRNYEDPVATFEEMAELRRHFTIPISTHVPDIRKAVALGAPDYIVTNFAVLGGISRAMRFIGACEAMGVGFWCYSGDTGIATAGYLHMSAAMPWISEPSQSLFRWQIGDVIEGGPFRQKNNVISVPEGPGLGVTLDRDALSHWHNHLVENGPLDHFYDPAMPGRLRRLPLN